MGKRYEHYMFLTPTNTEEVTPVNSCVNKYLTDCDGIKMSLVKNAIECISEPMTCIYNLSFKCGVFPHKMKTANKVIPLYKSGEKHLFTNCRPISLLPQFSKILEKLFYSRLEGFMNSCTILNSCQYGFRECISTSHTLVELLDDIKHSLEYKKCAIGVFIDFKKAFDTVDHQLLCKKLELYGIRGNAYNLINSFLNNHSQFVNVASYSSDTQRITCGVPQDSICGPKLFILYINDMCNVSKLEFFYLIC